MEREVRCPGYRSGDGGTRHLTWFHRPTHPRDRRYYCQSCDAYYPYLVDVSTDPPKRYSTTEPLGPPHKDDTNDYGNPIRR